MSDKVYEVPADWAKRAFIDSAKYRDMYDRSLADPNGFWAERPSASTGSSLSPRSRTPRSSRTTSRSSGSRTASPTSPITASTGISPSAATRSPSSGKATIPTNRRRSPIASCTSRSAASPTCCTIARRQEGRPRHHLHADDSRGGLRDARLRAHRRDPFRGVRRLLAGFARRPHRGLPSRRSSSPPTKACAAAARCRSRPTPTRRSPRRPAAVDHVHRRAAHRRRGRHGCRAATSGTTRPPTMVTADCPLRAR